MIVPIKILTITNTFNLKKNTYLAHENIFPTSLLITIYLNINLLWNQICRFKGYKQLCVLQPFYLCSTLLLGFGRLQKVILRRNTFMLFVSYMCCGLAVEPSLTTFLRILQKANCMCSSTNTFAFD